MSVSLVMACLTAWTGNTATSDANFLLNVPYSGARYSIQRPFRMLCSNTFTFRYIINAFANPAPCSQNGGFKFIRFCFHIQFGFVFHLIIKCCNNYVVDECVSLVMLLNTWTSGTFPFTTQSHEELISITGNLHKRQETQSTGSLTMFSGLMPDNH